MPRIISIKPGVSLKQLNAHTLLAVIVASQIYDKRQESFVITSGDEGSHMQNSLHYKGDAVDIRLPVFSDAKEVVQEIYACLGMQYDVILEKDHIHIEFDPK